MLFPCGWLARLAPASAGWKDSVVFLPEGTMGTTILVLAAHNQSKDEEAGQIANDPCGPGSGVKWFSVDDQKGNHWMIVRETKGGGHESYRRN
jgi:hypothetical protein